MMQSYGSQAAAAANKANASKRGAGSGNSQGEIDVDLALPHAQLAYNIPPPPGMAEEERPAVPQYGNFSNFSETWMQQYSYEMQRMWPWAYMMPPWAMGWPNYASGMPPGGIAPGMQKQVSGRGDHREADATVNPTKSRDRRSRKRNSKAKGKMEESQPSPVDDDDGTTIRCAALQEIRRHAGKCTVSFDMVRQHSIEFAEDQHGSRYLQNILDTASDANKDELLGQLLPEAPRLASSTHGSNVIQKLFDKCPTQINKLILALKPEILKLTKEPSGCRVIQKAIEEAATGSQQVIADELKGNVVTCIESPHGNFVIQKCIERMRPDSITFIVEAIETETERMAMHSFGCRVIQRLLEHCPPEMLADILTKILSNVTKFAQDQYGNYVVQHVLDYGLLEHKRHIIREVQKNILVLAKHKSSSNVVEKCFEVLTTRHTAYEMEQERTALFETVLGQYGDPSAPIFEMMPDQYGNYIVQKMMQWSSGPERELLKEQITSAESTLRNSPIGKHIVEQMEKM
eukprot:CAMPEP_0170621366 /NCGR_PEP_ID=MMETSP0224-20130122/28562_1 /TAXON_ID=285029 /ORGANISM="Togula jolla, Strain CCCM 725" /LENGTH=516 /DNA_ID=CAMNT_0010947619 /DNA_START=69 /DNA_END=1619 /DNA_ORIENTATION=-